jgi:DNA-binding PadR family transcriptional regulator
VTGGTGAGSANGPKRKAAKPRRKAASALTPADLVVLSLLAEQPMHGYQLNAEMDRQEVNDWAVVSRPHVYYSIAKLAKRGLIARSKDEAAAAGPERTRYRATAKGSAALAAALGEEHWATGRPPAPFITWVALSIHAQPKAVARLIAVRAAYLREQIAKERATLPHVRADAGARSRVGEQLVTLCIRQFEVELEWLESLRAAVNLSVDLD